VSAPVDEKETGRVEAFSDGVFAIAITLLNPSPERHRKLQVVLDEQ
jgi:hypothetical protein